MPIVWECLDGSIAVTQLETGYLERERLPGESTDTAVLRLAQAVQKKVTKLQGALPVLIKTADMPASRVNRKDWTLKGGTIDTASKP